MTEQQLKTIVGLFAGMQAAMVHLSNVMCVNAGISPEAMATSFEEFGAPRPASARVPLVYADGCRPPQKTNWAALDHVGGGIR